MSDTLRPNERLLPNQWIISPDGRFTLIYQSDGRLVLYRNYFDGGRGEIWSTWARSGSGVRPRPRGESEVSPPSRSERRVGECIMQSDGNLVIRDIRGRIWSTGTHHAGSRLVVQNDGNLVIYDRNNIPRWATNTVQPKPVPPNRPGGGYKFENWGKNVTQIAEKAFLPGDLLDVIDIIRQAKAANKHVHSFGARHSFSDVAVTRDYLVNTRYLMRPIQTVQKALRPDAGDPSLFYHVEAGINIKDLYLKLSNVKETKDRIIIVSRPPGVVQKFEFAWYDDKWSNSQQIPGAKSESSPALAAYGDRLYMAWRGTGTDNGIYLASRTSLRSKVGGQINSRASRATSDLATSLTSNWTSPQQIPGAKSESSPALAAYGDRLYMAWRGTGTDNGIYLASYDEHRWKAHGEIPGAQSESSPVLAVYGSLLYIAWKSTRTDESIQFASYEIRGWYDVRDWTSPQQIPGAQSESSPALAAYGDRLYMAWRGTGTDEQIYFASYDGHRWTNVGETRGARSGYSPTLAVYDNRLYMAWRGTGTDEQIYFASYSTLTLEAVGGRMARTTSTTSRLATRLRTTSTASRVVTASRTVSRIPRAVSSTSSISAFGPLASWTSPQAISGLTSVNSPSMAEDPTLRSLALESMGAATKQTLAGAMSTSTHGMDKNIPPPVDSIAAIHLVGASGTQYWIERRSKRITDPVKLRQYVAPGVAPENIIYDDSIFEAVMVSMGCMGIIYSMVLRVREQYHLIEETYESTWQQTLPRLPSLLNDPSIRSLQILLNPYWVIPRRNFCLVTIRREATDRDNIAALKQCKSGDSEQAEKALYSDLWNALKPEERTILKVAKFAHSVFAFFGFPHSTGNSSKAKELVDGVNTIVHRSSLRRVLIRHYSDFLLAAFPPGRCGGLSYRVMDLGFRGGESSDIGGRSIEMFFQLMNANGTIRSRFKMFVEALIKAFNNSTDTFLVGWVSLRFIGKTSSCLGMQQWDPTCAIEVSTLPGVKGLDDVLDVLLSVMYQYDGKPHWGQQLDLTAKGYGSIYPRFQEWRRAYGRLSGGFKVRTFENNFSIRWGLTPKNPANVKVYPFWNGMTLNTQDPNDVIRVSVFQNAITNTAVDFYLRKAPSASQLEKQIEIKESPAAGPDKWTIKVGGDHGNLSKHRLSRTQLPGAKLIFRKWSYHNRGRDYFLDVATVDITNVKPGSRIVFDWEKE